MFCCLQSPYDFQRLIQQQKHIQIRSLSEVKQNKQDQPSREISVALTNLYGFECGSRLIPLAQLRKCALCLCEGFLRRRQRSTHRAQVLWGQVMTYRKAFLRLSPALIALRSPAGGATVCGGTSPWCYSASFSPCAGDKDVGHQGHGTVWWPTSQVTRSSCHNHAVWYMRRVMRTEFGGVSAAISDTCPIDFVRIGLSFEKKKNESNFLITPPPKRWLTLNANKNLHKQMPCWVQAS